MTTPIDRAAEAVEAQMRLAYKCPEPGGIGVMGGGPIDFARAALTAALSDPEALANFIADERDQYPRNALDMDSEELAHKIIAWLTANTEGDES